MQGAGAKIKELQKRLAKMEADRNIEMQKLKAQLQLAAMEENQKDKDIIKKHEQNIADQAQVRESGKGKGSGREETDRLTD